MRVGLPARMYSHTIQKGAAVDPRQGTSVKNGAGIVTITGMLHINVGARALSMGWKPSPYYHPNIRKTFPPRAGLAQSSFVARQPFPSVGGAFRL